MNKNKLVLNVLCFLLLISTIIYSQTYIENHKISKNELLYFVPKKEQLAYTNFGFKSVVADLLWLRGVSYFMYHFNKDNDYKYLFGMFNACIILDPRFKQVYRDSMTLLLCDKEHFREAEKLILAGVNNIPNDWEMHYMAGVLYAYYLKEDEKSLRHLERCWGLLPRDSLHKSDLENINIMIRAITEKKNDKSGLILYWINKYYEQSNKESKEFCAVQIRKYVSSLMAEKLNQIVSLQADKETKDKQIEDELKLFHIFYNKNNLSEFIDVPLEYLLIKTDAFGYPWVYSERQQKYYSFGNAHEYLTRKINLFNIKLWEKLEKYLSISINELVSHPPQDRFMHVKLKPEYKEFPAFEEIFNEKKDWLKLEYPLFPIYNRAKGVFQVPEYKDVLDDLKIDKKYK